MCHENGFDDKFFARLEEEDARVAARVKAGGCPPCGGRLDRADYPRKPRGGGLGTAGDRLTRRVSFCCAREGCRKRATPPSLVFLGRRVYLAAVVLVASLPVATMETSVPPRTVDRWVGWFRDELPRSDFFTMARARLSPPIVMAAMPGALVERFARGVSDLQTALIATLRFLSPLTTRSVRAGFTRVRP